MKKPEFKLLPCIFCTVGFNCYVAGHKIVSATYQKITTKLPKQHAQAIKKPKENTIST
tara:strand:+ start:1212 stop:1385 length:174 start_codon:yes stop_codon:yes gene_type:complete